MPAPRTFRIWLDLGDAFAKAAAEGASRPPETETGPPVRRRLRFPSVVATRLLDSRAEGGERGGGGAGQGHALLLDASEPVLRPVDFDPKAHPRTGSYGGAQEFLEMASSRPAPPRSRFAGRLAAIYGADRQWLGVDPSDENVGALVHKALMLLCPPECSEAEVAFVVDSGTKAAAVSRYVSTLPRVAEFEVRTYRRPEPRRLRVRLEGRTVDAPACAVAALPAPGGEGGPGARGDRRRQLLIDIGHFRTKVAVFSAEGCELQDELPIGMADCVRRVLRDGAELGLVVDEFALIRALEVSRQDVIHMGKRRFDLSAPLRTARRAVEEELEKNLRRLLRDHYGRGGESCEGAVLFGGGAVALGSSLAARLEACQIGLKSTWIAPDPGFFLIEGAQRLAAAAAAPRRDE
jgi:hypothetical protein